MTPHHARGPRAWRQLRIATAALLLPLLGAGLAASAHAGGGPLGIDRRAGAGEDRGIWGRRYQLLLQDAAAVAVFGSALWEGDDTRYGHASWQAVDSVLLGTATSTAMKIVFSRERPNQTSDPNRWFRGSGNRSFPSGEVMLLTTAVTPYIAEYGADHPAVWGLALLPAYDAIARVRSRAHWQSDVLASVALGAGIGIYAHSRPTSLTVGVLPHGLTVGWRKSF